MIRTSGTVRNKVLPKINLALSLVIVMLTCGCQPTPEKTAVVYGGDLEEKIEASPAPIGVYNAPASWQETLDVQGCDIKIEINASISIPNVTAFPVYKVSPTKFDDTRIESLVDYFRKDRDVYKIQEATKAELDEQLILARKSNDEERVAELEKMIETAPETVEAEVITDWSTDQSPNGCFLAEDGEYAGISVSPHTFLFMKGAMVTEYVLLLNDKEPVGEIAISEEDAIASAQNMLHELGIDYMVADSLEKAQHYTSASSVFAEPSEKPVSKGYSIKFSRNIGGIAGIIDNGVSFYITDEFDYKAPLYPEEIRIYVDEAGIAQSFSWSNPLKIEEKLNENVGLLPFEDIQQRIRDMLTYINSFNSNPIEVTSIELHMTIIDVKDHPEEAMYVPAWFIYYTITYEDIQQEDALVLNAIDGGRVLEGPTDISPEMQQQMDEDS